MTRGNEIEHLCRNCTHAVRMPRSIGGLAFDGVECFELDKDVTEYPDRYGVSECESFQEKSNSKEKAGEQ